MAAQSEYARFVQDILSPLGIVTTRAMFGGYGVYARGVMFGLIAYDILYFKADDSLKPFFIEEGQGPFIYEGKGKRVEMSYWQVPERLFDDQEELITWAERSLDLALPLKKPSKPKAPKSKTRP